MLTGQKALDVFWSAKFKDCISVSGSCPVLWEHSKGTSSCLYEVTAPIYLKLPLLSLSRSHNINNLDFPVWMLFSSYSHSFSLDSLQLIHIFLGLVLKTRHVFPSQVLAEMSRKKMHSRILWPLSGLSKVVRVPCGCWMALIKHLHQKSMTGVV